MDLLHIHRVAIKIVGTLERAALAIGIGVMTILRNPLWRINYQCVLWTHIEQISRIRWVINQLALSFLCKLYHLIFWIQSRVDIFYCSSSVTSKEVTTAGSTKNPSSQYRSTLFQLFLARSMFNISICCRELRQAASERQGSVWWKEEWAHEGIKSFFCQANQESHEFMPYYE